MLFSNSLFAASLLCDKSDFVTMSYSQRENPFLKDKFKGDVVKDITENRILFTVKEKTVLRKSLNCTWSEPQTVVTEFDIVRKKGNVIYEIVHRETNRTVNMYLNLSAQYIIYSDVNHSEVSLGGGGNVGAMQCKVVNGEFKLIDACRQK